MEEKRNLDALVGETATDETLGIEDGVLGIEVALILRSGTNETAWNENESV